MKYFNPVCLRSLQVVWSCPCCWTPPERRTPSNPHSAGGTSAPNRARCSRRLSPFRADVPVFQHNTQARRQRTACANILSGIFLFPPLLFKWLSFRPEKMPAAGCYKFPAADAEPAMQAAAQTVLGICYGDRLQIKSCCLLGLPKYCRDHRRRQCWHLS